MRLLSALFALALAMLPRSAKAEGDVISRGSVGAALLGAELAVATAAVGGAREPWIFVLGSSALGLAAGYAGYRLESELRPEVSDAALVAGLTLLLPTTVWLGRALEPKPPSDPRPSAPPPSAARRARQFRGREQALRWAEPGLAPSFGLTLRW